MSTIDEMHRPAKVDLAIMRWRAQWSIRHGYRPAVIAAAERLSEVLRRNGGE